MCVVCVCIGGGGVFPIKISAKTADSYVHHLRLFPICVWVFTQRKEVPSQKGFSLEIYQCT